MLKRTLILLCILGGMTLGTTVPHHSHARGVDALNQVFVAGVDGPTAQAVLKLAAPQLGLSFPDAMTAYSKGTLTIVPLPSSGAGNLYDVQFSGGCIWILIADDL